MPKPFYPNGWEDWPSAGEYAVAGERLPGGDSDSTATGSGEPGGFLPIIATGQPVCRGWQDGMAGLIPGGIPGFEMSGRRRNRQSRNWADRHLNDPYVRKAQQSGYRARSAYKLIDIDRKYRLIRPDSRIADLGSSPGSWSQYASSRISARNRITCVDILPMDPLEKTWFIQGDFTDPEIRRQAKDSSPNGLFDLVLSDMAPNITGIRLADQANVEELQYAVLAFCHVSLKHGGRLLTKYFEGESANVFRKCFQDRFNQVRVIKPDASRPGSREVYLFGDGFKHTGPGRTN